MYIMAAISIIIKKSSVLMTIKFQSRHSLGSKDKIRPFHESHSEHVEEPLEAGEAVTDKVHGEQRRPHEP